VAGIPGDEATVKTYNRRGNKIVLLPANASYQPIELDPDQVNIYGKVVTIVRQL
jgi:repressor LexA